MHNDYKETLVRTNVSLIFILFLKRLQRVEFTATKHVVNTAKYLFQRLIHGHNLIGFLKIGQSLGIERFCLCRTMVIT